MSLEPRAHEHRIAVPGRGDAWVYEIPGPSPDAPTLLLIHGLGVTAHLTWRPSYAALAQRFRVVTLDLPGHGRGLRASPFRLEDCADDAVRVADALGVERPVVVGYSLGGTVAKLVWRRHPGRISGIVLAATAAEFARSRRARVLRNLLPVVRGLVRVYPDSARERLIERAIDRLHGFEAPDRVAEEFAGHDMPTLLQAVHAASRFSSRSWLGSIDVPVAVLITAQDDRIPPRLQREMAAAIPSASIFEVMGTHTACISRPETFVPSLVEACHDVWRRATATATAP